MWWYLLYSYIRLEVKDCIVDRKSVENESKYWRKAIQMPCSVSYFISIHTWIHTREKPYICAFLWRYGKATHMNIREDSLFLVGGATPSGSPYNSRESPYWRKRFFTCPFILPKDSEKSTIENFSPPLQDALKIFRPPFAGRWKIFAPPLT